jgi:hypothetical protein
MRYTAEQVREGASEPIRQRARELATKIWDIEVEGGMTLFDRGVIELALILLAEQQPKQ